MYCIFYPTELPLSKKTCALGLDSQGLNDFLGEIVIRSIAAACHRNQQSGLQCETGFAIRGEPEQCGVARVAVCRIGAAVTQPETVADLLRAIDAIVDQSIEATDTDAGLAGLVLSTTPALCDAVPWLFRHIASNSPIRAGLVFVRRDDDGHLACVVRANADPAFVAAADACWASQVHRYSARTVVSAGSWCADQVRAHNARIAADLTAATERGDVTPMQWALYLADVDASQVPSDALAAAARVVPAMALAVAVRIALSHVGRAEPPAPPIAELARGLAARLPAAPAILFLPPLII